MALKWISFALLKDILFLCVLGAFDRGLEAGLWAGNKLLGVWIVFIRGAWNGLGLTWIGMDLHGFA